MATMTLSGRSKGVSLTEMLVVISIMATAVALLLPAVQAAREASRRAECSGHARQLGFALQAYHDTYLVFPSLGTSKRPGVGNLGMLVRLLPFVEQPGLASKIRWEEGYDSNHHTRQVSAVKLRSFLCPSGSVAKAEYGEGFTAHYYGVLGPKGPGYGLEIRPSGANGGRATDGPLQVNLSMNMAAITDGTSNTLLVGEVSWNKAGCYRPWTRGAEIAAANPGKNVTFGLRQQRYTFENLNDVSFGSEHSSGCNFVRADGSTFFLHEGVELKMFQALASRNGNEVIQLP